MWTDDINELNPVLSEKYTNWLKPYHLSTALQRACPDFCLRVLYQGEGVLLDDELAYFSSSASAPVCYVRHVIVEGAQAPFYVARSAFSVETYQRYKKAFDTLGGKLIGDTLLYTNKSTLRSAFQYRYIEREIIDNLYLINELSGNLSKSIAFPARRSLFQMDGQFPLLLTEVFLENMPDYRE